MELKNRIALITGASSGVGREIALLLANEGAEIINADISDIDKMGKEKTHNIINKNSGKANFIKTDLSREDDIQNLADKVIEEFGRVDILINNAGVLSAAGLFDTNVEAWDKTHAINLRGPFLLSQKIAKNMVENNYGVIINICSVFGVLGHVASTAYIASKGGLIALTKQLAMELGKYNIRVNAVLPSTVYTGFFKEQRIHNPNAIVETDLLFEEERLERLKKRSPLHDITYPIDIANAVNYLVSDKSRMVTGICLPVDGGVLAGRLD